MNTPDPEVLHALAAAARADRMHVDLRVLHEMFDSSRREALREVDGMLDELGILSPEERLPVLERLDAQLRARDSMTLAHILVDLGLAEKQ